MRCSLNSLKKVIWGIIWMVIKIMVPFVVLNIIRHLVFRGSKRGP